MKEHAIRLKKGDDLKKKIEEYCLENDVDTAVVLSGVGCLDEAVLRLAKAESFYEKEDDFEIVSLTGTLSQGRVHIHISLADETGEVVGGHLAYGCIVNTTCELVLGELEEYHSHRAYDETTGYDEIVFEKTEVFKE